ncbi:MAG: hypothetical protein UT90_C0026G0008 [Parcubacteria group bacterium GW2011_GWA1_40_21]|nr:MAG: hypothetical protein UT90_C0026G0008 [Parcubacteria group bacterium GW2011_GWA1_40_21]
MVYGDDLRSWKVGRSREEMIFPEGVLYDYSVFGTTKTAHIYTLKQLIDTPNSTMVCVFIVPSSNLFPKQMIRRKPHALASTPATPKEKTLLAFLIWREKHSLHF